MSDASPSSERAFFQHVRVAEPTVLFWAAKAASTALGEAASDFSVRALPPVVAVLAGFVLFAGALAFQLTRRRYRPEPYWTAVAMVGVFGTMAADVMHVVFQVPYVVSSALYALGLALLFVLWRRLERTLSVHEVTTTRRELLYWGAVVLTFALGTAVGDLTAVTLGWGYLPSAVMFAGLILLPLAGHRLLRWDATFAFWFAYVLTRPLGASVADWLGKPRGEGGVGTGSGWVALGFALAMVALVLVMRRRAPGLPGRAAPPVSA